MVENLPFHASTGRWFVQGVHQWDSVIHTRVESEYVGISAETTLSKRQFEDKKDFRDLYVDALCECLSVSI